MGNRSQLARVSTVATRSMIANSASTNRPVMDIPGAADDLDLT